MLSKLIIEDTGKMSGAATKINLAVDKLPQFHCFESSSPDARPRTIRALFTLVWRGKHVINLFIQYTPYKPNDGSWDDPQYRKSFAQRCFNLIEEYATGFNSSIMGYDMLAPPDLEREFGLTGNSTIPFIQSRIHDLQNLLVGVQN